MNDIKIDIINPVRPYILFKRGDNALYGYVDTSNIDKGVRYMGHKNDEVESAYDSLKGWIKPLWDKCQKGENYHRDWLIDTPIDQLVAADCPDAVRKIVENLKALAIFYKYSNRKLKPKGYVEMYSYGRKRFTDEEREYIGKGESLDLTNRVEYYNHNLFKVVTDDDKPLTDIEKHLYEIKPYRHHLLQLEIDKVRHLITTESRYYGDNDWVGLVLDNPTKERLKEVQEWVDNLTAQSSMGYMMLFGAVQEGDKVLYKVMYMFNMYMYLIAPYRHGCKIISGFLGSYSGIGYAYNGMDVFSNRKGFIDRLVNEVEQENDYLLLKRGKSLDVLKRDRLVSGVTTDTSFMWPYLQPDLWLVDKPEAQYYCYMKAYSGSFDDEKRQELLEVTML